MRREKQKQESQKKAGWGVLSQERWHWLSYVELVHFASFPWRDKATQHSAECPRLVTRHPATSLLIFLIFSKFSCFSQLKQSLMLVNEEFPRSKTGNLMKNSFDKFPWRFSGNDNN
ncbi:hypothetical protein DITRI_Ditri09bG0037600 [Diplodiscus trichospermus]